MLRKGSAGTVILRPSLNLTARGAALTAGAASTGATLSVPTTSGTVVYPTTLVLNGAVTFQ